MRSFCGRARPYRRAAGWGFLRTTYTDRRPPSHTKRLSSVEVRPSGAIKSKTSSVLEKRISWACWHEKSVRHGQRATLVGLRRNFLCQHDVACDEVTFGRKAPTNTRTTGAVEFVDVHRGAVANPVSRAAGGAGDLKRAFRGRVREALTLLQQ